MDDGEIAGVWELKRWRRREKVNEGDCGSIEMKKMERREEVDDGDCGGIGAKKLERERVTTLLMEWRCLETQPTHLWIAGVQRKQISCLKIERKSAGLFDIFICDAFFKERLSC